MTVLSRSASHSAVEVSALEGKLATKDSVIAEVSEEYVTLSGRLGASSPTDLSPSDLRDAVVDFGTTFTARTAQSVRRPLARLGVAPAQFSRWTVLYGRANSPNSAVQQDHWPQPVERQTILTYHDTHAPDGYRRAISVSDYGVGVYSVGFWLSFLSDPPV